MIKEDTIIALATASGIGAIAIIRLSGPNAIAIVEDSFRAKQKNKLLKHQKSHTLHLGNIVNGKKIIDEVLVSVFKNPHSYTGEDVVEISCHGSTFIQQEIIQLFLQKGCRMADNGEFTMRAFLNGKMDLSQAEAVADVIASNSEASHTIAMQQMRGGITNELKNLRGQLLDFAALIELELDFSGEDVEFADRTKFKELVAKINTEQNPKLSAHFKIKSIPTLIVINQGNMVERFQGIVPIKNLEHLLDLYISENKKI